MKEYVLFYAQALYTHDLQYKPMLFLEFFAVYLAQAALLYFFAGRLFRKRGKTYKFILVNVCAVIQAAGTAVLLCVMEDSALAYAAANVIAMLWAALSLHFLYSDKLYCKTAYVLLAQLMFTVSDLLAGCTCLAAADCYRYFEYVGGFYGADNGGIFRLFFCTGLKIFELVILIIMCRQLTRIIITGGRKEWSALNYAAIILCTGSLLVSLLFFEDNGYDYKAISVALAAVLAIVIVMLRFFPKLCNLIGDVKPAMDGEVSEYERGNSVRQLQKLRHDVKNNIVTISALIDSGENAEAKRLLNELGERLTSALGDEKMTGIAAIDTTLSAKAALCEERGITLDLHAEPLPETKIPPIDLSSVLSNILDNAVEAAEQCPDPVINLRIFKYKMYLAIVCENPITDKPRTNGDRFITTKKNSRLHGCGTEIISEICRRSNGRAQFEFTENTFKAAAFLEI